MRAKIACCVGLLLVIFGFVGCAPKEPSSGELTATRAFATAMPGAMTLGTHGGDARWNVEGPEDAYATDLFVTHEDEAAVVAWHAALYDAEGWQPTAFGYVAMDDGGQTKLAWRYGDVVIGLGFPDRGWLQHLGRNYPEGTLYEVTITYRPPPSPGG